MKKITCILLVTILILSSFSLAFAENDENTATAVWSSVIHIFGDDTREFKITLTGIIGKQIDNNRVAFEEYEVKYLDKKTDDQQFFTLNSNNDPVWNGEGELDEDFVTVIPVVKGAELTIEVLDGKAPIKFTLGSYPFINNNNSVVCKNTNQIDSVVTGLPKVFDRTMDSLVNPYVYQFPVDIDGVKLGIVVLDPEDYPLPDKDKMDSIEEEPVTEPSQPTEAEGMEGLKNFKDVKVYTNETFSDITGEEWYANAINTSYTLGIMSGKGNNVFDPTGNIKVSEAIAMVVRTKDIFAGNSGDIKNDGTNWYDAFVKYAIANEIITDGQFEDYNRNATRAELAYLFAHALNDSSYNGINDIQALPDVFPEVQYGEEIFKLYNAGIVTGSDELGTFNPSADITRAEASAIINRVIKVENRKTVTLTIKED